MQKNIQHHGVIVELVCVYNAVLSIGRSLGCAVVEMLTGYPPYHVKKIEDPDVDSDDDDSSDKQTVPSCDDVLGTDEFLHSSICHLELCDLLPNAIQSQEQHDFTDTSPNRSLVIKQTPVNINSLHSDKNRQTNTKNNNAANLVDRKVYKQPLSNTSSTNFHKHNAKQSKVGESNVHSHSKRTDKRIHVPQQLEDGKKYAQTFHQKHSFVGLPENTIIEKLFRGELPLFTLPTGTSNEAFCFISRCFKVERKSRPSASELLGDPFVRGTQLTIIVSYF